MCFAFFDLSLILLLIEKRLNFFLNKPKIILRSAIGISFTNLNEQKNYFSCLLSNRTVHMRPFFQ